MEITIDSKSGFCFGVVTAINKAEKELESGGRLYCLGDIVHNSDEVERLRSKGLITVTHEEFEKLHNVKVLLRAHGEPPSTYEIARRNNIEIIDATCPVVLQLQRRIKQMASDSGRNPQIVIYGKEGHAEVNGLVGQARDSAIVVPGESALDRIDFSRDVELYSQTTMSLSGFASMISVIRERMAPGASFNSYDTICRQVASRVDALRSFVSNHDLVLFVSGVKSSNGRFLYAECKAVNAATRFICNPSEIDPEWLEGVHSVGICGATSTPRWLMEQVRDHISNLCDGKFCSD